MNRKEIEAESIFDLLPDEEIEEIELTYVADDLGNNVEDIYRAFWPPNT